MNYMLEIKDGSATKDTTSRVVKIEYGQFKVLNNMFKNGKEYKKDDIISLEKTTANRFIKSGDVKEIK